MSRWQVAHPGLRGGLLFEGEPPCTSAVASAEARHLHIAAPGASHCLGKHLLGYTEQALAGLSQQQQLPVHHGNCMDAVVLAPWGGGVVTAGGVNGRRLQFVRLHRLPTGGPQQLAVEARVDSLDMSQACDQPILQVSTRKLVDVDGPMTERTFVCARTSESVRCFSLSSDDLATADCAEDGPARGAAPFRLLHSTQAEGVLDVAWNPLWPEMSYLTRSGLVQQVSLQETGVGPASPQAGQGSQGAFCKGFCEYGLHPKSMVVALGSSIYTVDTRHTQHPSSHGSTLLDIDSGQDCMSGCGGGRGTITGLARLAPALTATASLGRLAGRQSDLAPETDNSYCYAAGAESGDLILFDIRRPGRVLSWTKLHGSYVYSEPQTTTSSQQSLRSRMFLFAHNLSWWLGDGRSASSPSSNGIVFSCDMTPTRDKSVRLANHFGWSTQSSGCRRVPLSGRPGSVSGLANSNLCHNPLARASVWYSPYASTTPFMSKGLGICQGSHEVLDSSSTLTGWCMVSPKHLNCILRPARGERDGIGAEANGFRTPSVRVNFGLSLELYSCGRLWGTPLAIEDQPASSDVLCKQHETNHNQVALPSGSQDGSEDFIQMALRDARARERLPSSRVMEMSVSGDEAYKKRNRLRIPALYFFVAFGRVLGWRSFRDACEKQCALLLYAYKSREKHSRRGKKRNENTADKGTVVDTRDDSESKRPIKRPKGAGSKNQCKPVSPWEDVIRFVKDEEFKWRLRDSIAEQEQALHREFSEDCGVDGIQACYAILQSGWPLTLTEVTSRICKQRGFVWSRGLSRAEKDAQHEKRGRKGNTVWSPPRPVFENGECANPVKYEAVMGSLQAMLRVCPSQAGHYKSIEEQELPLDVTTMKEAIERWEQSCFTVSSGTSRPGTLANSDGNMSCELFWRGEDVHIQSESNAHSNGQADDRGSFDRYGNWIHQQLPDVESLIRPKQGVPSASGDYEYKAFLAPSVPEVSQRQSDEDRFHEFVSSRLAVQWDSWVKEVSGLDLHHVCD